MTIQVPESYVKILIRSGISLEFILSNIMCYSDSVEESKELVDLLFLDSINWSLHLSSKNIYRIHFHETSQ